MLPSLQLAADPGGAAARRAGDLFAQSQHDIHTRTDRLFAGLMAIQWVSGIVFALWVSPLAWSGTTIRVPSDVWAAIFVGGAICLLPALLGLFRPGVPSTRYTIAVAQMLMGALLIHLTGGRIQTHFHVFASLALLAFYRDWRVLVPATLVVALDHLLRGMFWPQSMYGELVAGQWRWLEHGAWVLFEDVVLVVSCRRSIAEMRAAAERTAALEQEERTRQQAENVARLTAAVGVALTRGTELRAMLQQCVEALVEHLEGGFARIWTLNEAEQILELQAGAGMNIRHDAPHVRVPVGRFTAGSIARTRTPVRTSARAVELPVTDPAWSRRDTLESFVGYPLLLDSKLVGVMGMFAPREFSSSALDAMTAVADAVALGIERKRAEQELRIAQRRAEEATRARSDLLALVNGILDSSKIEADNLRLSPEQFDVRAMVDGLVHTISPLVHKNENRLTVECADEVGTMYADLVKTRQILLNLLGNATKFTRRGAITLDVRSRTIRGRGFAVFSVTNTGVGMTPEQTEKIFDRLPQADVTTTRRYGRSTGLSLGIVSRFSQLMGGDLSVESRPGHGSRFVVQVPLEAAGVAGESVPADAA